MKVDGVNASANGPDLSRLGDARTGAGLTQRFPLGLKFGFWASIVIGIAIVIRRVIALTTPPRPDMPAQLASLDAYFAAHATLTFIHILCALGFVLLLPLLFWSRTRTSLLLERMFFVFGAIVGSTAYAMSAHSVGGWLERSAVLFFNTLFLFALYRAWTYRDSSSSTNADREQKQRWMLRAIAILLGIATTRPVMGVFFATAAITHLTPQQFFGIAFWIGFSFNTIVMELWLRTRSRFAFA
jgi:putative flippase GtrA